MFLYDILLYLNFSLFIFAIPFIIAARWEIRPEKTFLPGIILNSMVMYVFAIFHKPETGFWIIYGLNMLLYLPVIFFMQKKGLRETVKKFLTPGLVILFAMLTVFFLFTRNLRCYSWDSISHWMTIVKYFFAEGKLCCEYSYEIVKHASYPPGMAMTAFLVHKTFFGVPFREGFVILAHILPIYGSFAWFFSKLEWKHTKALTVGVIISSLIIPLLYYFKLYHFCYTDFCLSAVMAITFYQLIMLRNYRVSDLLLLAIMNGWLFMIRNSGWGYSIAIMIIFAIFLITDRSKALRDQQNGKFSKAKIFSAILVFLIPLLMKYSWEYLLHYYSTTLRFGGTNITWQNFKTAFCSFHAYGWQIFWKFLIKSSLLTLPTLIPIGVIAWAALRKTTDSAIKRGFKITICFFIPGTLLYLGSMFIFYVFEFTDSNFPSLGRYFFSFTIIPVFIIFLLLMEIMGSKSPDESEYKKYPKKIMLWIAAAAIISGTFTSFFLSHKRNYVIWRNESDAIRKYDYLLTPGIKYGIITTTGNGFKVLYMQYLYPHNHRPTIPYDPVIPGSPESQKALSESIFPDGLREKFKTVDYIYFDNPKENFLRDFSSVFVGNYKPELKDIQQRMFKVTPEGKLEPID